MLRDVDHPANTQRRVDHEPLQRLRGALGLQLQHVVQEYDGLREIAQEVADAGADEFRDDMLVAERDRAEDCSVEPALRIEQAAVEPFERIALDVGVARGGRGGRLRLLCGKRRGLPPQRRRGESDAERGAPRRSSHRAALSANSSKCWISIFGPPDASTRA